VAVFISIKTSKALVLLVLQVITVLNVQRNQLLALLVTCALNNLQLKHLAPLVNSIQISTLHHVSHVQQARIVQPRICLHQLVIAPLATTAQVMPN
jgi:hypothetical protein